MDTPNAVHLVNNRIPRLGAIEQQTGEVCPILRSVCPPEGSTTILCRPALGRITKRTQPVRRKRHTCELVAAEIKLPEVIEGSKRLRNGTFTRNEYGVNRRKRIQRCTTTRRLDHPSRQRRRWAFLRRQRQGPDVFQRRPSRAGATTDAWGAQEFSKSEELTQFHNKPIWMRAVAYSSTVRKLTFDMPWRAVRHMRQKSDRIT